MGNIKDLKSKTLSGFFWKFIEKILAQVISLVISIFLARLLTPDDYSVVGIVMIFFAFANVFISGGFNAALIQKKDVDIRDYSSVFTITMILSAIIYIILFFVSPYIAKLYSQPILIPIFRVMGLVLFVNALASCLQAYISSTMQFKKSFVVALIGTVVSGTVGVAMAFMDFGPWALVAQNMISSIISTIGLVFVSKIKLKFKIYKANVVSLLNYGWKVLATSFITVLYDEINPLIIGIKFSAANLSYYTKGKSFPKLVSTTISDTLASVLFPAMAKIQDEKNYLLSYTRQFMRTVSFIVFPMMLGFLAVADKFVLIILTEKWLPASKYIQAFCIVYMFDLINVGNLQVVRATGRSDILLILEIIKKSLYAIVILLFVIFTDKPEYLAIACIINALLAVIINAAPNKKLIGYGYLMQLMDILPNLITALIMGGVLYFIGMLNINIYLLFILQIFSGVIIYFVLNLLIRNSNINYIFKTVKGFIKR